MWVVHKSGYRGIAAKVRAGVRIRATRLDRTTGEPSHRAAARGRSGRRWSTALVNVVVAAVGSISLLALGGLTAVPASAASGAPAVSQCNPPDFPTGAGYQVTCTVSVDNYTSPSGGTISTVTTSACLAAAGVVYPSCPLNLGPVVSTTSSFQLVTSVNQCNGIANGAGSNVYCNVTVTNHIPAGTTESGVTVNQCVGSAATSTQACAPLGSTTNATVTQCNGSANGGGTYASELAAGCTVTGADSALPVTINQCNGTSNGGGSAVTCMATVADVFVPASTTPTTPTTPRHRRPQAAPVEPPRPVGPWPVDSRAGAGEPLEQAGRPAQGAEPAVRPGPLRRSYRREPRKPDSAAPLSRRGQRSSTWAASR